MSRMSVLTILPFLLVTFFVTQCGDDRDAKISQYSKTTTTTTNTTAPTAKLVPAGATTQKYIGETEKNIKH